MATSWVEARPDLAALWDAERNTQSARDVGARSSAPARWRCEHGHRWVAPVAKMTQRKRGCPTCASLAFRHPDLAAQWDFERNGDLKPSQVTHSSGKSVHWVCAADSLHRWSARINARVAGSGCPVCSGRSALAGRTDLATTRPDLAAQWDFERNGDVKPDQVKAMSGAKAHWVCPSNPQHRWVAIIANRSSGSGCPVCSGNAVAADNSLATKRPNLAAEVVGAVQPAGASAHTVSEASTAILLWSCPRGHQDYPARVYSRTCGGSGCPVCANKAVQRGVNDLATTDPQIADEWVAAVAGAATPATVTRDSDTVVTWVCSDCGRQWAATVASRAVAGSGCPRCHAQLSRGEDEVAAVVEALARGRHDVVRRDRTLCGRELDIAVPGAGLAVEYNGLYWHSEAAGKGPDYHRVKTEAAAAAGLTLIHVWEDDWKRRRDVVVRLLAHKLGATARLADADVLDDPDPAIWQRLGARSLRVKVINASTAHAFMDANHIQGRGRGSLHVALVDGADTPRAVLTVRSRGSVTSPGDWIIERFATRGVVAGAFGRLEAAAARHLEQSGAECWNWFTFSDLATFDGGVYERLGYAPEETLPPDYRYVVRGERRHKFSYRLSRFRKDPDLVFVPDCSERELADINGLERIWDCGKIRWVKPFWPDRLTEP